MPFGEFGHFKTVSGNSKKRILRQLKPASVSVLKSAVPKLRVATPIGVNLPRVAWQFAWGRLIICLGSSDNLPGVV